MLVDWLQRIFHNCGYSIHACGIQLLALEQNFTHLVLQLPGAPVDRSFILPTNEFVFFGRRHAKTTSGLPPAHNDPHNLVVVLNSDFHEHPDGTNVIHVMTSNDENSPRFMTGGQACDQVRHWLEILVNTFDVRSIVTSAAMSDRMLELAREVGVGVYSQVEEDECLQLASHLKIQAIVYLDGDKVKSEHVAVKVELRTLVGKTHSCTFIRQTLFDHHQSPEEHRLPQVLLRGPTTGVLRTYRHVMCQSLRVVRYWFQEARRPQQQIQEEEEVLRYFPGGAAMEMWIYRVLCQEPGEGHHGFGRGILGQSLLSIPQTLLGHDRRTFWHDMSRIMKMKMDDDDENLVYRYELDRMDMSDNVTLTSATFHLTKDLPRLERRLEIAHPATQLVLILDYVLTCVQYIWKLDPDIVMTARP